MPTTITYKTSGFCTSGGCVEVALMPDSVVAVRDSKDRNKPPYFFSLEDWRTFVAKVKKGDLDFFDHRFTQSDARIECIDIDNWRTNHHKHSLARS